MAAPAIGILEYSYVWSIQTRNSQGANADADSAPTYSIYEHEVSTAIVTGTMTKLGSNAGLYTEDIDLAAASGFETLHSYQLKVDWTISGRAFSDVYSFIVVGDTSLAEAGGGDYPVALADMKLHLRVESGVTADDTLITTLISAATEWCQDFQRRKYIQQTVIEKYDGFPGTNGVIRVPYPPLVSVTSIQYVDTAGDTQTLSTANYTVDTTMEPGRIVPAYNCIWPTTRNVINAVTLTYLAGYGAAADVPDSVKAAIKLLVGNWYENREQTIVGTISSPLPFGVRELLWPNRVEVL